MPCGAHMRVAIAAANATVRPVVPLGQGAAAASEEGWTKDRKMKRLGARLRLGAQQGYDLDQDFCE